MRLLPPAPGKHKIVVTVGMVCLTALVLGAIYGDRGLIDLQRLRAEQRQLERVAFRQQQANAQLRDHLRRLRSDDQYLERWARQRLRWAKPGEIIYHFPEPASARTAPSRSSDQ
ncbi:MAG TPA: septum formation initiator family protein [Candidatus Binatia bacterium]|nr:septum formation initiator family protein [Candidatus Binatia bacterium]